MVKTQVGRATIEALLADKPVAMGHTGVFGYSTKWSEKAANREAAEQKLNSQPVTVHLVDAAGLKALRSNTGHVNLISYAERSSPPCLPTTSASINTGPRTDDGR